MSARSAFRGWAGVFHATRCHLRRAGTPAGAAAAVKLAAAYGGLGWLGVQVCSNTPSPFILHAKSSANAAESDVVASHASVSEEMIAPETAPTSVAMVPETAEAESPATSDLASECCPADRDCPSRIPPVDPLTGCYGSEIEGLDTCLELLAAINKSANAADDDDDDEDEGPKKSVRDDMTKKTMGQLLDEALKVHEREMVEHVPGKCEPSDQTAEDDFRAWVGEADKMFRERQFEALVERLRDEYKKTKGRHAKRDPQLVWRLARVMFMMGNEVENNTMKFWKEALIFATESIKQFEDPSRIERHRDVFHINHSCCWKCHLWFGIVLAKLGGLQEDDVRRIKVAMSAKMHLERAAMINPLDPVPMFALAKWHYEFCKVNAGQGRIIQSLGYRYPLTDVQTALKYAERANDLSPKMAASQTGKFPRNVYLMSELYYVLGRKELATYHLETLVVNLAPFCISIEDKRAVERGRLLLTKIRNPVPNNPHDSTPRAGKLRPYPPLYPDHHGHGMLFEPVIFDDDGAEDMRKMTGDLPLLNVPSEDGGLTAGDSSASCSRKATWPNALCDKDMDVNTPLGLCPPRLCPTMEETEDGEPPKSDRKTLDAMIPPYVECPTVPTATGKRCGVVKNAEPEKAPEPEVSVSVPDPEPEEEEPEQEPAKCRKSRRNRKW